MKEIKRTMLNDLGNELVTFIKKRTNVFKTIEVVVPNLNTAQWFKSYWLKSQNDILMNVKFLTINEALLNFIDIKETYSLLNKEDLKSLIIKNLMISNINLPYDIEKYFNTNNSIDSIKLYDLANQLAQLFIEYENDQFEISGWQKELYDYVLFDASKHHLSTLSYLYNFLSDKQMKNIDSEIYFFGFHQLTNLQNTILKNYENNNKIVKLLLCKEEFYSKEFLLTGAPSKLREIESVHSKICSLIKEQDIEYSDVLVLAPDISLYENIIARVFKQDNVKYPNIPYSINDRKKTETNVSLGLKKLFEIINKKYYTRLDFFTLINNKDIQRSRNITEEDVINWSKSIVAMNAYRNSEGRNDWEYVKKRVLLSKLSNVNDIDNNMIELQDNTYIPFSNIEFDDESIIKFVSIIDDLQSWIDCISIIKTINKNNLELILNKLNNWFSIKDSNGFETNGYYRSITSIINNWIKMQISNDLIPLNTLVYQLFDASKIMKVKTSEYFVRGITFADFDINAILSSKYIFFLNAGSKELPKQVFKSELDLRKYDISQKQKIEYAFYLQYQNANENFYVSYINKNLKTDEDLYLSSIVSKLYFEINTKEKNKNKENEIKKEKISLDETREWSELFTKKSHENKIYFEGLIHEKDSITSKDFVFNVDDVNFKSERRKKIRVKEIADFLEEPLKYKINYLFSKEDSLNNDIKEEYEPFELDSLTNYGLIKNICLDSLINKKYVLDEETIKKFIVRFNLSHQLPDITDKINSMSFNKVIDRSQELINYVINKTNYNYEVINLDDLTFIDYIENDGEIKTNEWSLTCKDKVCRSIEGLSRTYIQIKKISTKGEDYEFLFLYIFSLMDLASLIKDNNSIKLAETQYSIELCRGCIRKFTITPKKAKEILISIYNMMNSYQDNVCLPIKLFEENKITSLNDLIKELIKDNGVWAFFEDKNIFDYDTQLGYTEENFMQKFSEKRNECIKLIEYYKNDEDGSVGEDDE